MLGSYLFNKIAVGPNNGLVTASEPGEGYHDHVHVHGGEYLGDGGHQAGPDAISMSIGVSLKFARDKIAHKHKIWAHFGCFMAKIRTFWNFSTKSSQNVSNGLCTLSLAQDYWYLESTGVISSTLEVIVKWNKDSIEYLTIAVA